MTTGWIARRFTSLEVTDLGLVGELLAELSSAGADLAGPSWHLSSGNPAYGAARRAAATDARQKATDYAEALGLSVQGIAWAAEPGLRSGSDSGVRAFAVSAGAPKRRNAGGGEPEEVLDMSAPELTVHFDLEVGFRLSPASVSAP